MTTKIKVGLINADAVETASIKDANVTAGKLATNAVTTAKILDANVTAAKLASGVITLPIAYIAGLKLSNDADASHDVNITAGAARDATDTEDITLSSEITKRIDAAWAVGDDAGGLDTGAVANTTLYYIWLILRSDTSVVDALFSASATSPTMPTNYDYKRLIGCVKTDGSANITAFTHAGNDLFLYKADPFADVSAAAVTNGAEVTGVTLSAPPGSNAIVYLSGTNSGHTTIGLHLYATGSGLSSTEKWATVLTTSASNIALLAYKTQVLLDASSQCSYNASEGAGTATISISTQGFEMITRSNP